MVKMPPEPVPLTVIVGPTGAGKTALARGLDDRQLAALVDFVARARGRHAGVLVLSDAELARRLMGQAAGGD